LWLDKESISLEKQGIDGEIKQKGNKKGNSCQDQARPPPGAAPSWAFIILVPPPANF